MSQMRDIHVCPQMLFRRNGRSRLLIYYLPATQANILDCPYVYLSLRSSGMLAGPIRMGACRHGQEGHLPLSGNVVKYFCELVVTAERSLDESLFSQPVVGFWLLGPQAPTGTPSLYPAGGNFFSIPLICPPLEKIMRPPITDTDTPLCIRQINYTL